MLMNQSTSIVIFVVSEDKQYRPQRHSKSGYICQKCDFTANSKVNLTSHIQAEHEGGGH